MLTFLFLIELANTNRLKMNSSSDTTVATKTLLD